jgi:predicted ATP-dependent serine protease
VNHFFGQRSILAEMEAFFLSARSEALPQKILVLSGMGGIGKSQIALAYASRHRKHYKNCLQIDASSKKSTLQGFAAAAAEIRAHLKENKISHERTSEETQVPFVKAWLSQRRSRWLIIFDNHDNPEEVELH